MFGLITGNSGNNINSYKYIKHDSLLLLNYALRSRMIFGYIYSNTPEKIAKEDLEKLDNVYMNKVKIPQISLTTFSVLGSIFLLRNKKIKFNQWFSVLKYIGIPILINSHVYHGSEVLFSSKFIKSDLVGELALKYNFGIFDFTQSKKDSCLKSLTEKINEELKITFI